MRDPARIAPTLETIRNIWNTYPDLRLGQLILNLNLALEINNPDTFFSVLYQMEDDELVQALNEHYFPDPQRRQT